MTPMTLTTKDLARLIDLSSVRAECAEAEIRELAATARRLGVVCVFALPCYTRLLASLLADAPHIGIGGVVGFPSGAHVTAIKVAEARQLLADGATELDMVLNVGWLRSGHEAAVRDDIRAVVEAAGGVPVKVILECHWLTAGQIRRACELCLRGGSRLGQDRHRLGTHRRHPRQSNHHPRRGGRAAPGSRLPAACAISTRSSRCTGWACGASASARPAASASSRTAPHGPVAPLKSDHPYV